MLLFCHYRAIKLTQNCVCITNLDLGFLSSCNDATLDAEAFVVLEIRFY